MNTDIFKKIDCKKEVPAENGWYFTDKGSLFCFPKQNKWSCRDDRISDEYPTWWLCPVTVKPEICVPLHMQTGGFEVIPFKNYQGTNGKAIMMLSPDDYEFFVESMKDKIKGPEYIYIKGS